MNLSQLLSARAKSLWKEAAEKPFVTEMARGCLSKDRFRRYMLQDYLYLLDYIDILRSIRTYTQDPSLQAFLDRIVGQTEQETYRVHVPNMKEAGVSEEEIRTAVRADVITAYVTYMRRQLTESGLMAGLTALLQCSWVYAYIGEKVSDRYGDQLRHSPYRSWFDAYTCPEYIEANQLWIDVLDREAAGISPEESERLCRIFRQCAVFEGQFWDALYGKL